MNECTWPSSQASIYAVFYFGYKYIHAWELKIFPRQLNRTGFKHEVNMGTKCPKQNCFVKRTILSGMVGVRPWRNVPRLGPGKAQSSLHARVFKDKTYVQYFPLGNFARWVGYCSHETKCSSSSMSSHPMMPMITCQDVSVCVATCCDDVWCLLTRGSPACVCHVSCGMLDPSGESCGVRQPEKQP